MNTATKGFKRMASLALALWLTAGLVMAGDWVDPAPAQAYRAGAVRGPAGGVAARGAYGGAAVRGPSGAAAVRGPYGGAAARGPNGAVVAAPRGRVVPPPPAYYGPGYRPPVPVPVPVPVAPAYYGPSGSSVAAGMALGAMLTILPATAVAMSAPHGQTVYVVENTCYKEVRKGGTTYYERIPCP